MKHDEQKYPVGIQSFPKIIEGGFTYVDKTRYIKEIVDKPTYYFLSRPRRFGKSLWLSTLDAFFQGRRELFKGLAIDSMDVDWTPSPVLHFDFNAAEYTEEDDLYALLDHQLRRYETIYGRNINDVSPLQRLRTLIHETYKKTGHKVVVLIDDYDKPLLNLDKKSPVRVRFQAFLRGLYGCIKTMDHYLNLVFITGVTRISRDNILNELNYIDISHDDRFADICGWTEDELLATFRPGIEDFAENREEDFDTTLVAMRQSYAGYLFTPKGSFLYNPFSVLCALHSLEIRPFWFTDKLPELQARLLKINQIRPTLKKHPLCEEYPYIGYDPLHFLYNNGLYTIQTYIEELNMYRLHIPNQEAEYYLSQLVEFNSDN